MSRKFAEKNTHTKLKAMMVLNTLAQNPNRDLVESLSSALEELRKSEDDKVGREFFALQGIEEAAALASTAAELEAVHLTRLYAPYVFSLVQTKSLMDAFNAANDTAAAGIEEYTRQLVDLLVRSVEVSASASHPATPLNAQCKSIIALDQKWIASELQRVHEKHSSLLSAHVRRVPELEKHLREAGFGFTSDQNTLTVSPVSSATPKNDTVESESGSVVSKSNTTHRAASVRKTGKSARPPATEHCVASKSHRGTSSSRSTVPRSSGININVFEALSTPARTIGTSSVRSVPPALSTRTTAQSAAATRTSPAGAVPTTSSTISAADASTNQPAAAKAPSAARPAGATAPVPTSQVRLATATAAKKIIPASAKPPAATAPSAAARSTPRAPSAADVATSKLSPSNTKPPQPGAGAGTSRAKPGPSLAGKILSRQKQSSFKEQY